MSKLHSALDVGSITAGIVLWAAAIYSLVAGGIRLPFEYGTAFVVAMLVVPFAVGVGSAAIWGVTHERRQAWWALDRLAFGSLGSGIGLLIVAGSERSGYIYGVAAAALGWIVVSSAVFLSIRTPRQAADNE